MSKALPILSPTQLDKGSREGCARAYGLEYVSKVRPPQKPSAAAGTAIHRLIEQYFKTGSQDMGSPYSRMALAARAWLPKYEDRPQAEFRIIGLEVAGGTFGITGDDDTFGVKVDCYLPNRRPRTAGGFAIGPDGASWPTHDAKGRPIPLVIDVKTTGDKRLKPGTSGDDDETRPFIYQATADELRGDSNGGKCNHQVLVYGKKAILDFVEAYGEEPELIQFRWCYVLRDAKHPRCKVTDFVIRPHEIARAETLWAPDIQTVHWIRTHVETDDDVAKLPANLLKCGAYGGCAYSWRGLGLCQLTEEEELKGSMPMEFPDLKSKLDAQAAAFAAATAAAMAQAPVAATATTPPPPAPAAFGLNPSVFVAPVPPTVPPVPTGPQFRTEKARAAWAAVSGYFATIADAQKPNLVKFLREQRPDMFDDESAAELHAYVVGTLPAAPPPPPVAPPVLVVAPPPPTPADTPTPTEAVTEKKAGRPKGAKNKPKIGVVLTDSIESKILNALAVGMRAAADALVASLGTAGGEDDAEGEG